MGAVKDLALRIEEDVAQLIQHGAYLHSGQKGSELAADRFHIQVVSACVHTFGRRRSDGEYFDVQNDEGFNVSLFIPVSCLSQEMRTELEPVMDDLLDKPGPEPEELV